MANDILDGYVFINEESILNLSPRDFSGDIQSEVFPGDTLYVCYDLDEAESVLADCQARLSSEYYDADIEPDDLQVSVLGTQPVPVRELWDSGKIANMGLLLEPFYNMEED